MTYLICQQYSNKYQQYIIEHINNTARVSDYLSVSCDYAYYRNLLSCFKSRVSAYDPSSFTVDITFFESSFEISFFKIKIKFLNDIVMKFH